MALLPVVSDASYLPEGISDHTPFQLTLQLVTQVQIVLSSVWVGESSVEEELKPHLESFWQINEGSTTDQTEWDAFKATT